MLLTAAGKIGAGKTSITNILSDFLGTKAIYEPVDDNPLLEKFYEDRDKYGFVFQIDMISRRFELIQDALLENNAILDRSILEDSIFLDQLFVEKRINKYEKEAYHKLLERMLKDLDCLPKRRPDLLIYIDVKFEDEIDRINLRAREFEKVEKGTDLYEYFKLHSKMYDEWISNFDECPVLIIDALKYNYVNNEDDRNEVLRQIISKMVEVKALTFEEGLLHFCKIENSIDPLEIAIKLYNRVQTLMGGGLEYHQLSNIYDNKIDTIELLENSIKNKKGDK